MSLGRPIAMNGAASGIADNARRNEKRAIAMGVV